jgi:hypothetical protein
MSKLTDRLHDGEVFARFVHFASRVRSDGTVRPEAFMPPPDLELSVTRHGLGDDALWARGVSIGHSIGRSLVGRADITGGGIRAVRPLNVVAAPLPDDPEHAHIVGWPRSEEKSAQKVLAMSLAANSFFVHYGEGSRLL